VKRAIIITYTTCDAFNSHRVLLTAGPFPSTFIYNSLPYNLSHSAGRRPYPFPYRRRDDCKTAPKGMRIILSARQGEKRLTRLPTCPWNCSIPSFISCWYLLEVTPGTFNRVRLYAESVKQEATNTIEKQFLSKNFPTSTFKDRRGLHEMFFLTVNGAVKTQCCRGFQIRACLQQNQYLFQVPSARASDTVEALSVEKSTFIEKLTAENFIETVGVKTKVMAKMAPRPFVGWIFHSVWALKCGGVLCCSDRYECWTSFTAG
jgi:hypothetical protein